MNDINRFYAGATLAVLIFLALFGGAGLWIHAEHRGADQWHAEAQKQKDAADLAVRELSSSKHALDELRGESSRQRASTEALASELRTELAAHRTLLANAANRAAQTTPQTVTTAFIPQEGLVINDLNGLVINGRANGNFAVAQVPQINGRGWGPEQATGAPNTLTAGDQQTAWASRTQDEQPEWLLLEYAEAVNITKVKVYETYHPGALVRVSAFNEKTGEEVQVWSGVDPTPRTAAMGTSEFTLEKPYNSRKVKIYLDSPAVPGWNEIDAVGIIDDAGRTLWATNATASSTYADVITPLPPEPPGGNAFGERRLILREGGLGQKEVMIEEHREAIRPINRTPTVQLPAGPVLPPAGRTGPAPVPPPLDRTREVRPEDMLPPPAKPVKPPAPQEF